MKVNIFSSILQWIRNLNKLVSLKVLAFLFLLWGALAVFYQNVLFPRGLDVPKWFPIAVIYETGFHRKEIPYLIVFVLLLFLLLFKIRRINEYLLIFGCFLLIIFGNLMQGGFEQGFLRPFDGSTQYLTVALDIPNVREWLANFNANQHLLNLHTKTHPPFAVLIHDFFLVILNYHVKNMVMAFAATALLTVPLLMLILRIFGVDVQRRKLILLLFAVIPAVNIYSIACLDSVVMTSSTIFLLGVVILLKKPNFKIWGFLLMASGLVFSMALNYGAIYLLGVGALAALYDLFFNKRKLVLIGLGISVLAFIAFVGFFSTFYHYNYIESFLLSSKMENPDGFRLFSDPQRYWLSRFEDISEIAFFLSFGVLSVFCSKVPKLNKTDFTQGSAKLVMAIGVVVLLLVLFTGAYQTGETARACLFIFPYLMLGLTEIRDETFPILILIAGTQTAIMQMIAGYFW